MSSMNCGLILAPRCKKSTTNQVGLPVTNIESVLEIVMVESQGSPIVMTNTKNRFNKNQKEYNALQEAKKTGKLINFRDLVQNQEASIMTHMQKMKKGGGHEEEVELVNKYTPQELALLRALKAEKDYVGNLEENNGKTKSPQTRNMTQISIDKKDQFSPDNWLPRSSDLIRLTGKHPLNAEAPLSRLYDAGIITPNELHYKVANYIKQNTETEPQYAESPNQNGCHSALEKHGWLPVKLIDRKWASRDTRTYTFQLPEGKSVLGLATGQHGQIGFHMLDRMLIRTYPPTKPLLPPADNDRPAEEGRHSDRLNGDTRSFRDGSGTFELTVKTYFPDENQPGGALSNILDCIPIGEEVELCGPTREIAYNGYGNFVMEGKEKHFDRVALVLGGSGITPGYSLIARILLTNDDETQVRMVDANKTEADILLRNELNAIEKKSNKQLRITHVISYESDDWKGKKGLVDEDIIKQSLFEPSEGSAVFLCGPPAMIQKAALPALKDWGYVEDENMFGF
ncbi:hypothetical protein BGZ63DRAFT_466622 [Mariannaea sp. PMI_226]|nr:hypothetical protein BGZ63DRAFT_466622 [Mariannaea sp. PMI_226]